MSSHLDLKEGIYNPLRRFAVTNTNDEMYELKWDGKVVARLQPGDTVELPHHLAVIAATQIADLVIMKEVVADEKENKSIPGYRSKIAYKLQVPDARKPYEDKIIKEIEVDTEAPQFQVIVAQKREELLSNLQQENAKSISSLSVGTDSMSSIKAKK